MGRVCRRRLARPGSAGAAVAEDHQPGWPDTAPAHGEDPVAAFANETVFIPDLDVEARASGDGCTLVRERLRIEIVGRHVDQPAGEIDALGDQAAAIDGLDRRGGPDRGAESCPLRLGTVQVLPNHADGGPGHGLFDLLGGPRAIGDEHDAATGPAGEVPRGGGRGAVDDACGQVLSLAQSDHEQLTRPEPGSGQQGHAFVAAARQFARGREPGQHAAGGGVELRRGAAVHSPLGQKVHDGVGVVGVGAGGRLADDARRTRGGQKLAGHARCSGVRYFRTGGRPGVVPVFTVRRRAPESTVPAG